MKTQNPLLKKDGNLMFRSLKTYKKLIYKLIITMAGKLGKFQMVGFSHWKG